MEYTLEKLKLLLDSLVGTIVIYEVHNDAVIPLLYTPDVPSFSGLTDAEYLQLYGKDTMPVVAPSDLEELMKQVNLALADDREHEMTYRTYHKTKGFVWTHNILKKLGMYRGNPIMLCSFTNVTETIAATNLLLDNSNQLIYVIERDSYDLLYANKVALADKPAHPVLGQTCYEFIRGRNGPCSNCIVSQLCGEKPLELEWYDEERAKTYGMKSVPLTFFGKKAYAFFVDDLTRHIKLEAALKQEKEKYRAATEGANLRVYEYDVRNHSINLPEHARKLFGVPHSHIEHVPESILNEFLPEDTERVRRFFARIERGEPIVRDEFQMRQLDGTTPYLRYTFTTIADEAGRPVRAYAVAEDITAQKQEERNFQVSLQALLAANPWALCSFQLNLSQNRCGDGHGASTYILNMLHSDTSDGLFKNILVIIPDAAQRAKVAEFFNREKLLAAFSAGNTNFSLDYQRLNEKRQVIWVRTYIKMLRNPETQDIIGVFNSLDITSEKRRENIFKILTSEEYDYVALVHAKTKQIEFFNLSYKLLPKYHAAYGQPGQLYDFDATRQFAASTWIDERDRAHYWQASSIKAVQAELDVSGHCEISVRGHYTGHPEETMCRKIQHYYLDNDRDTILIVQSDVTETFLQQQRDTLVETVNGLPTSSAVFCIYDNSTIVPAHYSEEFLRMVGFSQNDSFPLYDAYGRVHGDDQERLQAFIQAHINDREPFRTIYRIITKTGTYMWVSVNFNRFSIGDAEYLYAVYTNIDELKKQEQLLEEQYNSAQAFLDSVSDRYIATQRANLTKKQGRSCTRDEAIAASSWLCCL